MHFEKVIQRMNYILKYQRVLKQKIFFCKNKRAAFKERLNILKFIEISTFKRIFDGLIIKLVISINKNEKLQ